MRYPPSGLAEISRLVGIMVELSVLPSAVPMGAAMLHVQQLDLDSLIRANVTSARPIIPRPSFGSAIMHFGAAEPVIRRWAYPTRRFISKR